MKRIALLTAISLLVVGCNERVEQPVVSHTEITERVTETTLEREELYTALEKIVLAYCREMSPEELVNYDLACQCEQMRKKYDE